MSKNRKREEEMMMRRVLINPMVMVKTRRVKEKKLSPYFKT